MWDKALYILIVAITVFVFSKYIKQLQYYFKFFLIYFFITFNSLMLMPIFILNGKNVKNGRLMAETSKNVTELIGVTWYLRNSEIASEDRGAVIVINHQSSLDLLGVCNLWFAWKKLSCVVKKELFYFWPFGLGLWLMDAIFVDRGNPKDAKSQLQTKSDIILKKKIKILVFPEGTRNSDHTKLLPFKKGAFNIAVGAQVPIIPIVISRYYFINKKLLLFNTGHVIAECLEPVSTEGLTMDDIPELSNRVQNKMQEAYNRLSAEVTSALPSDYPLA